MPFGGPVLEAKGLWSSVSERGGRVWKSSVFDRERAREELRKSEYQRGSTSNCLLIKYLLIVCDIVPILYLVPIIVYPLNFLVIRAFFLMFVCLFV